MACLRMLQRMTTWVVLSFASFVMIVTGILNLNLSYPRACLLFPLFHVQCLYVAACTLACGTVSSIALKIVSDVSLALVQPRVPFTADCLLNSLQAQIS